MLGDKKWETSFLGSDPGQVTSFSGPQIPPIKRRERGPIGTLSDYHTTPLNSSSQMLALTQKHPGQKDLHATITSSPTGSVSKGGLTEGSAGLVRDSGGVITQL